MVGRNASSVRVVVAIVVMLGAVLACQAVKPSTAQNPVDQPQQAQNPPPVWQSAPGTEHAPEVSKAGFIAADCPPDFSGLDSTYGPGALYCRYHWTGDFGASNLEMRVTEYQNGDAYRTALDSSLGYEHGAIDSLKSAPAANNDHVEVISDSLTEVIYMHTYDTTPEADNPTTALCGEGWGTIGVNGKYIVEVRVEDVCGESGIAADCTCMIMTLREAALAAIARAEAAKEGS